MYVPKSVNDMKEINLTNQTSHKASCSFGSCTEVLFQNSKFDELEKRLKQSTEVALAESAAYLLEKLPIDEQVVYDDQFLGHQNHGGRKECQQQKGCVIILFRCIDDSKNGD